MEIKKYFTIFILMFLFGCANENNNNPNDIKIVMDSGTVIHVITFDGCEYINLGHKGGITHKGNCKNPIHSHSKL